MSHPADPPARIPAVEQIDSIENAVSALRAVARGESLNDWALEQHARHLELVLPCVTAQAEEIARLTQELNAITYSHVTTYTPALWATLSDDERYEEYIRVRQALHAARVEATVR